MKKQPQASGLSKFILIGLGAVIALLGLALAAGGVRLVGLGGSLYFLIGGLAMTLAGLLIALRKPLGAWLFAAFLVGTAVWAVLDTDRSFWPMFSRLFMFSVIGLVVALVYPTLVRAAGGNAGRGLWRGRGDGNCSGLGSGQHVRSPPQRAGHRQRPGPDSG